MTVHPKLRKALLWALVVTLLAGLVYAANELLQANKSAADAGSSGADMEMASLDTIKPSTKKAVDKSKENSARKKVASANAEYKKLAAKAKQEASAGKVSPATRDAGMASARRFQQASDEYAALWENNGSKERADLARNVGLSRVKNADMIFSDLDSDKISAYNDQQDALSEARKAYLQAARDDVSDADRAAIKSDLNPRLEKMQGDVTTLISSITSLLDQIKGQAGGISAGSIGGCAKQAASGASPVDGAGALLSPVTSLLNLAKSMGSNVQALMSDLSAL